MSTAVNQTVQNANNAPNASLYIGDLQADVTEALLFEIFNAVGPVASIRICRDAVTRRSLGYAYVNFHNAIDAERALDTMNFISIRGRPCRIMWSQRDPALRKSGVGNVFVKNLDKTIDHKHLYDTFSMFGNILSCKVAMTDSGESRGYGFVHYADAESAQKAIRKVDGMVIAEKKVCVNQFIPKEQRTQGVRKFTNVYVSGFPKTWTQAEFEEKLGQCGTVNSVHLSEKDGKPFGFANFPETEDAAKAVEVLNGQKIDEEHTLYVSRAMKKAERSKYLKDKFEKLKTDYQKKFAGVNLYVKYLDDTIDDERLRAEFEKFGTITSCKVMLDNEGRSRGFGFVCFENQEESTKAMAEMNSKIIEGKPLYVALAQRKEIRKANLEKERRQKGFQNRGPGGPHRGPGPRPGMRPPMGGKPGPMTPGYPQGPYQNNMMNGYRGMNVNPMMFQQPRMGNWQQQGNQVPFGNRPGQNGRPPMNYGMPPMGQNMMNQGPRQPMGGVRGPQNPQMGGNVRPPQPKQPQPKVSDHTQPLTSDMLGRATSSQQKQMIGERIFPRIQSREPKLAGKITGMLLEMDNLELLHLLDNDSALTQKINEALAVLNQHNEVEQAGAE